MALDGLRTGHLECQVEDDIELSASPASTTGSEMTASERELAGAVVEALRPLIGELVRDEIGRVLSSANASRVEWLTVEEYAERRHTTVAAVHQRLRRGQVPEAFKEGRRWLIPVATTDVLASMTDRMDRAA